MANIGLFWPNRCTASATVSGGAWQAALPASNVCDPQIAKVARSTNALAASTRLQLDLGSARSMRAFALVNHNFSANAQWRVLLGTTSGASDVYAGTLANWLHLDFEAGLVAQGMEDGVYLRNGTPAIIILPGFYSARHVTVEISDTGNADGYVQIGRAFAGGGFIPTINAVYGLQDSWVDLSTAEFSEGGSLWGTARRRLRMVRLVLQALTTTEGEQLHEMQRVLGTIDEVLYVPDIASQADMQRFGMLGTLSEMSALEYPFQRYRSLPIVIRQKG